MKPKKEHKKGQESTIGKIIYGFLLFMPLIAILSTILYATFNKNAYLSYYGENLNDYSLEQVNCENLETNIEYNFSNELIPIESGNNTNSNIFFINYLSNESIFDFDIENVNEFRLRFASDNIPYLQFFNNNNLVKSYTLNTTTLNFNFVATSITFTTSINKFNYFNEITFNKVSFVSEAFYYSVDRVTESPLFNWAENSVIYTTMNATCTQLSITTPFIPLLLSYWLIISVIYFLYDIALMLIWALHDRIHEIKESIS